MGNWRLILIRNLGIEYANDRLSLNGRSARLRQDKLGCLCVNVNPRITYNMTQSPWDVFRDGDAERITFTYDSAGGITATDAFGNAAEFYYDYRNLLLKFVNPLDNALHLAFDDEWNLVQITGPGGLSYSGAYDDQGNLTRITDPLGNLTRFAYGGPYDRLTAVTDANGNRTDFEYDAQGNLVRVTDPGSNRQSFDYDGFGNIDQWVNGRGHVTQYLYNAAGLLTRKISQDGSSVDYVYDGRGNLISATDPTGTTTFDYDPATDRLMRITYPGGRFLEFSYDAAGKRTSSVDQLGHRLDYRYDAAGRLESIADAAGDEVVRYWYDAARRIERKELANGVYTTYQYTPASQVLQVANYAPDDSGLSQFDYTYDAWGRRTAMDTVDGLWTYEYDDVGRLVHAVFDSANPGVSDQDLTYVYDAMGNRTQTIINGVTTPYATNRLNQYAQVGDTAYVYDADGNLIRTIGPQGTTTYSYDDENRLIAVTSAEGQWQYAHDALGNRVAVTEDGVTSYYVVDPMGFANVVGEYDAGGNLVAHYDHGFELLGRESGAGDSTYFTFDAIGNTAKVTDDTGLLLNSYAYTPFGLSLAESESVANPYEFSGVWGVMEEPNSLDFMRARFYDPALGRFISVDPAYYPGLNSYAYANSSPLSYADPEGRKCGMPKVYGEWGESNMAQFEYVWRTAYYSPGNDSLARTSRAAGWEVMKYAVQTGGPYVTGGLTAGIVLLGWPLWPAIAVGAITVFSYALPSPSFDEMYTDVYCAPSGGAKPPIPNPGSTSSASTRTADTGDPNEKTGPAGYGEAAYVAEGTLLAYRVDFENEVEATAPAQRVVITDRLDAGLAWTTFELTEIGFGDHVIVVPSGSQHFESTVPMTSGSGKEFELEIQGGIDAATGEVSVAFQAIDPATGLPPDVLTGFLPPEDGTGRGQGYFSYVVRPRADLPTGAEIRNVALIQFDFGETIATNQVDPHDPNQGTDPTREALVTIDAGLPESQVQPLPALVPATFLVEWAGQDDAGGSGIAGYDIYVSDTGRPYVLWLDDTTETSAAFVGKRGHTYAFDSIAIDNVGHTEDPPAEPDAETELPIGQVDFVELQDLPAGERLYQFQTTYAGLLTIEEAAPGTPGAVELELYDPSQNWLATSRLVGDKQRIDFEVVPGQTYYFKINGTSDDVDLVLVNLVARSGNEVTVLGTADADTFTFDASASRKVTINGVEYSVSDAESVTFDGGQGEDTAVFHGSPAVESVELWPGQGEVDGDGYVLTIENVEIVAAHGGAGGRRSAPRLGGGRHVHGRGGFGRDVRSRVHLDRQQLSGHLRLRL